MIDGGLVRDLLPPAAVGRILNWRSGDKRMRAGIIASF